MLQCFVPLPSWDADHLVGFPSELTGSGARILFFISVSWENCSHHSLRKKSISGNRSLPCMLKAMPLAPQFVCPFSNFFFPEPVMHLHIEDINRHSLSLTSVLGVGPGYSHTGPRWLHSTSEADAANLSPELELKGEHSGVMSLIIM